MEVSRSLTQTTRRPIEPSITSSTAAELFVVPSAQIALAWPEIEKHISRVRDVPWIAADVRCELEERRAQAWGMREGDSVIGFWITRIENTWTKKFGLVWICAGDGLEVSMPAYREVIEPWLWSQGCEWIDIQGRKGWKRVLPDYEEIAVVLRKRR